MSRSDWKRLNDIRRAHAYHRVDLDLLWDIAVNDFPRLAQALGPLVDEGSK